MEDIVATCIELLDQHGVSYIAYPDYHDRMKSALYDILCDEVDEDSSIENAIEIAISTYVGGIIPERSEPRILPANTKNINISNEAILFIQ